MQINTSGVAVLATHGAFGSLTFDWVHVYAPHCSSKGLCRQLCSCEYSWQPQTEATLQRKCLAWVREVIQSMALASLTSWWCGGASEYSLGHWHTSVYRSISDLSGLSDLSDLCRPFAPETHYADIVFIHLYYIYMWRFTLCLITKYGCTAKRWIRKTPKGDSEKKESKVMDMHR